MADEKTQEEIEARDKIIELMVEQARLGKKGIDADIAQYLEQTKLGKAMVQGTKATVALTGGFKESAKALGSSTGNFNDLSAVVTGTIKSISGLLSNIPIVGKAFKFLGDAAAETASFAIGQVQSNFESFTELSKAGQIGADGITGMAERFRAANLPLATYTKLLTKNSADLAFFSTSALQGGKTFSKMMVKMAGDTGKPLRRLGLTVDEIGQTVVDFQKMRRRNGLLDQLNQEEIRKGTVAYARELDLIAKLTGKSREGIQKEREEAMSDSRFRAALAEMGEKEQEAHKSALNQITDPNLRRAYMDQLSGFTNSTASITMEINGMGKSIREAQALINSGAGTHTQAVNIMKRQAGIVTAVGSALQQHTKVVESGTSVLGQYAPLKDFAVDAIKTQKEISKDQLDLMNSEGSKTDLLITAMMKMQQGIAEMNYFFIATDAATLMISKFSEVMRDSIKYISDKLLEEGGSGKNYRQRQRRKYADARQEITGRTPEEDAQAFEDQKARQLAQAARTRKRAGNRGRRPGQTKVDEVVKAKEIVAETLKAVNDTPFVNQPAKVPKTSKPETPKTPKAEELVTETRKPIKWLKITPEMVADKKGEYDKKTQEYNEYKKSARVDGFTDEERRTKNEMALALTKISRELHDLKEIAAAQKTIQEDTLQVSKFNQ